MNYLELLLSITIPLTVACSQCIWAMVDMPFLKAPISKLNSEAYSKSMMTRNFYELIWEDFSLPRVIGKTKKLRNSKIRNGVKIIILKGQITLNNHILLYSKEKQ